MDFETDLSRWFGQRAFLGPNEINRVKEMVRDYHNTMHTVADAANSISYVARGIGNHLHGLGINGPWQELGNPFGDMYAENVAVQNALPGVTVGQSNTPAQTTANTQIALGETVTPDIISNDPNSPYTVTPDYVAQTTATVNAIEAAPGEALNYVGDTVSKYLHYALWIGVAAGVIIFLPEIKAITRTLRSAAK